RCLTIDATGQSIPISDLLRNALSKYRLGSTWDILAPQGKFDFSARVTLTARGDGTKAPTVAMAIRGPSIKPSFFPSELSEFSAKIHATENHVLFGECS